jgi:hypothetical protein
MDEIWTLGIVAIRLSKAHTRRKSDRIPVVMKHGLGKFYTITARRNYTTGRVDYAYYRLLDNDGKKLQKPVRDKWVYVLSGFGTDPLEDGSLTSRVSTMVKQEAFIELNYAFSLKAGLINCNPTLYSQKTRDAEDIDKDKTVDYYGGQDTIRQKERDTYNLNEMEIKALAAQQKLAYAVLPPDENPLAMKKQHENNHWPLPVGHTLVRTDRPTQRTDWRDMNEIYQELQAAAYGVPRVNIMTGLGVRQTASAELATRTIGKSFFPPLGLSSLY